MRAQDFEDWLGARSPIASERRTPLPVMVPVVVMPMVAPPPVVGVVVPRVIVVPRIIIAVPVPIHLLHNALPRHSRAGRGRQRCSRRRSQERCCRDDGRAQHQFHAHSGLPTLILLHPSPGSPLTNPTAESRRNAPFIRHSSRRAAGHVGAAARLQPTDFTEGCWCGRAMICQSRSTGIGDGVVGLSCDRCEPWSSAYP